MKVFSQNPVAKIERNLMIQFQGNTQRDRGKDGQTLYHRVPPATARGLTCKTAVNWHLKVKDIKYDVVLTESYCITVSLQKISSIHKYIQQILRPHELINSHAHF